MGNIYRLSEFYVVHWIQQENRPILNQIYDILTEIQAQDKIKNITLCKLHAHMGIERNEEADKAEKYVKNDQIKTTLYRLILNNQG